MNKLISLVIPTRNRPEVLLDSLSIALRLVEHLQIIIVDNSDTDALRHALDEQIAGGDVVYHYSDEMLSGVANFERGVQYATGDYVMFIGDDDCIGPGLVEVAQWASDNGVDAVLSYGSRFIANYYWPGVMSRFHGVAYGSSLFVQRFTGKALRLDCVGALRAAAADLGSGLGNMPRLYHGLVARRVVTSLREIYGHAFGGISPDIYNATLLSATCTNAWQVDFPFVIPGGSPASTAAQGAARTDRGRLDKTEHITRLGASLRWNPLIPAQYSGAVVWAHSLTDALQRLPSLKVPAHYGRIYARCIFSGLQFIQPVGRAFRNLARLIGLRQAVWQLGSGLLLHAGSLRLRLLQYVRHPRPGGRARHIVDIVRISDAYQVLCDIAQAAPLKLP